MRLYPETATVSLDDRTADRQPDAHAAALGRVERIEQPIHCLGLETDACVLHADPYTIAFFPRGSDRHLFRSLVDAVHRL